MSPSLQASWAGCFLKLFTCFTVIWATPLSQGYKYYFLKVQLSSGFFMKERLQWHSIRNPSAHESHSWYSCLCPQRLWVYWGQGLYAGSYSTCSINICRMNNRIPLLKPLLLSNWRSQESSPRVRLWWQYAYSLNYHFLPPWAPGRLPWMWSQFSSLLYS